MAHSGSETQRHRYSHGLEKIYSFEVLSPDTVRPLAIKNTKTVQEDASTPYADSHEPSQLTFDFGPYFSETIKSSRLDEPLEALSLSPLAYKAISTLGTKTVGELALLSQEKLLLTKGMGQGHIEEMKEKLLRFLGTGGKLQSTGIDLLSLIRLLFHTIDPKDRSLFLSRYGLGALFPLKAYDLLEIEKWDDEFQEKVIARTLELLRKNHLPYLENKLAEISLAFIKPWLEARCGFAVEPEIIERLFMVVDASQEKYLLKVLDIFKEILLSNNFCFEKFLVPVEKKLYAQSEDIAESIVLVQEQALSYFYSKSSTYPLQKLSALICRDCILKWQNISSEFIERILRATSLFSIFRDEAGTVVIGEAGTNSLPASQL